MKTVERDSIVSGGSANVLETRNYDSHDRLVRVDVTGDSKSLDGTAQIRTVSTFYLGAESDPLGRVTEVRGPCLSQVDAGTCLDSEPVPSTLFSYYAIGASQGANSGKLLSKTSIPDCRSDGGLDCAGASGLTTSFVYDSFGNVVQEVQPSGSVTLRQFAGSRLLSETVKPSLLSTEALTTIYDYDADGNLRAVVAPTGEAEVYCYRLAGGSTCVGGLLTPRIQWKGKVPPGTSGASRYAAATERVYYEYNWGQLTQERYVEKDSNGVLQDRRLVSYEADTFGRPTYQRIGTPPTLGPAFVSTARFDENDNKVRMGFAYRSPPAFCKSSAYADSNLCLYFAYDRLNRLVLVENVPASGSGAPVTHTKIEYDRHGNIKSIADGCPGSCVDRTDLTTTYEYDDFGNLLSVTPPWSGATAPRATRYQHDARGNRVSEQSPAMLDDAVSLQREYDGIGRELSLSTSGGQELRRFWYDDQRAAESGCSSSNSTGRLQVMRDSLGEHWYQYDGFGRVIKILRRRWLPNGALGACYTDHWDDSPNASYAYDQYGRLQSETLPHGRKLTYKYGVGTLPSQISSLEVSYFEVEDPHTGLPGLGTPRELIGDIRWEPYGGLRKYRIATETGIHPTVEYLREGQAGDLVTSCQSSRPTSNDFSGRLRAVWVSRSGNGDIYRRAYRWEADQVAEEQTCLKNGTAETVRYQYDNQLRLTSATRPNTPGFRMADRGGAIGRRTYSFGTSNDRGNRAHDEHDCWGFDLYYDGPDRLDRLKKRVPTTGGCLAQACSTPLPIAGQGYATDVDGRVTKRWTPESYATPYETHAASQKLAFDWDSDATNAALGGVFRQVLVSNGASSLPYDYFYDGFGRRRFKTVPSGDQEFFYDGLRLLEVRHPVVLGQQTYFQAPLDEYIWLDGRPVALLKSSLNLSDGVHDYENNGTALCDSGPCGTYFIVTDHLGKPVVMLDSAGRVTGTGDYDPFGHVNRATYLSDTAHPHPSNGNQLLASIKQPVRSGIVQQVRARYAMVDTASGAYAYLSTKDDNVIGSTCAGSLNHANNFGANGGSQTSCWVNVPSDGILHVRFRSGAAVNTERVGIAMESYEFRRAETGAAFVWTALRLPGQYHDAETDLFENWNRFYDPSVGRYLSPDPILLSPRAVVKAALAGMSTAVYAYAGNNPIAFTDPKGLEVQYADQAAARLVAQIIQQGGSVKWLAKLEESENLFRIFGDAKPPSSIPETATGITGDAPGESGNEGPDRLSYSEEGGLTRVGRDGLDIRLFPDRARELGVGATENLMHEVGHAIMWDVARTGNGSYPPELEKYFEFTEPGREHHLPASFPHHIMYPSELRQWYGPGWLP